MTVKEVFDLRKQGRIEEAYEAIRPMYAAHKGRYTTLCMFWTAADVFKLRLEQGRVEEAEKILEALKRMLPRVEEINKQLDSENATSKKEEAKYPWEHNDKKQEGSSAAAFIATATRRLEKKVPSASKRLPLSNPTQCETQCGEVPETTHNSEPRRGDTATVNPSHPDNTSASERLPINNPAQSEVQCVDSATTNSQLLNDYPGHMIVSLEDGIIRPIADLNAPQRIVLACLVAHPGYSVPQISASTGIPAKSIERHVSALIDHGLIEHRSSKKAGGYYAL